MATPSRATRRLRSARCSPRAHAVEVRAVSGRTQIGRAVEAALRDTADRRGTADVESFVITLAIQRETGGNRAETSSDVADVLRKRARMKLKIRAMSSAPK